MNDGALDLPVIEPRCFVHLDVGVDDRMVYRITKIIRSGALTRTKNGKNTDLPLLRLNTKCLYFLGGCLAGKIHPPIKSLLTPKPNPLLPIITGVQPVSPIVVVRCTCTCLPYNVYNYSS